LKAATAFQYSKRPEWENSPLAPAFSSRRQALALALLLALLVALPALMASTGLLKRRDVYSEIAWDYGAFPWFQQQIFDQKSGVDMAFLGSSHILFDVDTPYVQRKLSQQLGRPAEVFTMGWTWPGFDTVYTIAHDLLEHRKVHTLVIYDENGLQPLDDLPHVQSWRWFVMGEAPEAFRGLPLTFQARLYGGAVLGMPRHLLSLARRNLPDDPLHTPPNVWTTRFHAPNPAEYLGSMRARLFIGMDPNFAPYHPPGTATSADVAIYSPETREAFWLKGDPARPYQLYFARMLAKLCAERGTQLVFLHLPIYSEAAEKLIPERRVWSEELGAPAEMVGIPPTKLFAGIPPSDLAKLYIDGDHFNLNGQQLFTPLITPALLKVYANAK
jgi:hypothetical protein